MSSFSQIYSADIAEESFAIDLKVTTTAARNFIVSKKHIWADHSFYYSMFH